MAFVDAQTAATIIFGTEPSTILLKDTVIVGDILGQSDGWKRALATTGGVIQGRCIAAEPGGTGDKIRAYFGYVIMTGRFTGGTKDAALYVDEGTDDGKFTETAPTDTGDADKKVGAVLDALTIIAFPTRDDDSVA